MQQEHSGSVGVLKGGQCKKGEGFRRRGHRQIGLMKHLMDHNKVSEFR